MMYATERAIQPSTQEHLSPMPYGDPSPFFSWAYAYPYITTTTAPSTNTTPGLGPEDVRRIVRKELADLLDVLPLDVPDAPPEAP